MLAIVPMTADHAADVRRIFQQGIDAGDATFETAAPPWEVFDAAKLPGHRFVAVEGRGIEPTGGAGTGFEGEGRDGEGADTVLGYVVASAVSQRACYAGVVELSVYVAAEARGRGVGSSLLSTLIASTEAAGIWTIKAGIFPENAASVALHTRHGFRILGRQERIGRTATGAWRDVLLLERRSRVVN